MRQTATRVTYSNYNAHKYSPFLFFRYDCGHRGWCHSPQSVLRLSYEG